MWEQEHGGEERSFPIAWPDIYQLGGLRPLALAVADAEAAAAGRFIAAAS